MLCIHTITYVCWFPNGGAAISGNVCLHTYIRIMFAQLACLLRTVNKSFPDNDWLLQIINAWITCSLNHGAWVFNQTAEGKASRCLPNMPEGSRQSFLSHAETDRSRVSFPPTCYHHNKAQCLIDTSEWGGTPIILSGIAPCRSNYAKLLTKEKQVCETGRHFANLVASFVAILSHCLFLLLQPSPRALARSVDSA